jgi:hypothetical protein
VNVTVFPAGCKRNRTHSLSSPEVLRKDEKILGISLRFGGGGGGSPRSSKSFTSLFDVNINPLKPSGRYMYRLL